MAIVDARILQSLTITERKGEKQTKQYSAMQEFLVLSDVKHPSYGDIIQNADSFANLGNRALPQLDDLVVERGIRFYVTSRELSPFKENERAVRMIVRYEAKDETGDAQPDPPDGTDPQTYRRITIQTQQITKPAMGWPTLGSAIAGLGALVDLPRNSAGDPVDGIEEDTALVRMTYTNTQVLNPNFQRLQQYTNTCNSNDFLGGNTYTVRCVGWSGEYDQKNNVWQISVEFLFNPKDWSIEYYDVGFNELKEVPPGNTRERVAILDVRGNPVSSPVALNGNGEAEAVPGSGPVPLNLRYLFPYPAVNMANIWNDCGI